MTYLSVFSKAVITMFDGGIAPLMAIGASNGAATFVPVGSNSTMGTGDITYNLQLMKRGKAGVTPDQTANEGDNLVAFYNSAQHVDFETIPTQRGAEKSILFVTDPNEEFDFGAADGHAEVIASRVKSRMIEGEEMALAKVVAADAAPSTVDASTVVAEVLDAVYDIQELSDEYKHYSDDVFVLIHPRLAKAYADLEGTVYSMGADTFASGFKGAFMYDGVTYIPHKILNSMEGLTVGNVIGAIVLDSEAYVNAGLGDGTSEINDILAGKRFVGHRYSELDAVVMANRIKVFEFDNTATAKVND